MKKTSLSDGILCVDCGGIDTIIYNHKIHQNVNLKLTVKTLHAYQSYVKDKGTTVGKKALKKKGKKTPKTSFVNLTYVTENWPPTSLILTGHWDIIQQNITPRAPWYPVKRELNQFLTRFYKGQLIIRFYSLLVFLKFLK